RAGGATGHSPCTRAEKTAQVSRAGAFLEWFVAIRPDRENAVRAAGPAGVGQAFLPDAGESVRLESQPFEGVKMADFSWVFSKVGGETTCRLTQIHGKR